jgi:hypothetical protein
MESRQNKTDPGRAERELTIAVRLAYGAGAGYSPLVLTV